jgi:ATP-dependent exoDNAse (exonuclease V) beta subunit
MATNYEITQSIEKLRRALREQRSRGSELDPKGEQLSAAVDQFLQTSESFLRAKNPDQAFQRFIANTIAFGERAKKEAEFNSIKYGSIADASSQQFANIGTNLKYVVSQMFTSADTRGVLREIEKLLEKIFDITKELKDNNKKITEMPKESRERIVRSVLGVISKCGKTPALKDLRSNILALFDYWSGTKENISPDLQREFSSLVEEGMALLNRFSTKDIFTIQKHFQQTYDSISKDKEACEYFSLKRKWTDELLENPESADSEESVRKGIEMIEKAINVADRHQDELSSLLHEIKDFISSMQEEEYLNRLADDITGIGQTLKGSYLNSLVQIKALMAPIIAEGIKGAKLPRILFRDPTSSWSLDNLVLSGKDSYLDDIMIDFRIGLRNLIEVTLLIRDIDVCFKNVDFQYERTAMPAWEDRGKLDIRLVSPGWKIHWVVNQKPGREPFFELSEAFGKIRNLDITITRANHTWIDSILVQLWTPSIRKATQEQIERILRERAVPLTDKLNQFFADSKAHPEIAQLQAKNVVKEPTVEMAQSWQPKEKAATTF